MSIEKCLKAGAAYVMAPCCVGKIKLSALNYPRSKALSDSLTRAEFEVLARAADFGHSSTDALSHSDINRRRRRCKTLLEHDRNSRAAEAGYRTYMFVMHPSSATPKNDVIVGIPAGNASSNNGGMQWSAACPAIRLTTEEAAVIIFGE